MKEWLLSVGCVLIITSVIGMVLPGDRIGTFIRSILSLILIFVMIKPILSLKNTGLSFDKYYTNNIEIQTDFIDYVAYCRLENYKKKFIEKFDLEGIKNVIIDFNYELMDDGSFKINKIIINLKNIVINNDISHIDIIEKVINEICDYLNTDRKDVVIYE